MKLSTRIHSAWFAPAKAGFTPLDNLQKRRHIGTHVRNNQYVSVQNNSLTGFTVMELVIAVGIFSVVMVTIIGSFLQLNTSQKILRDKQQVLDELRFVLNLMGQEIIYGSAFPDGCDKGCTSMTFATQIRPDIARLRREYKLDIATGIIMRAEQKTFGPCSVVGFGGVPGAFDPACYTPFTSPRMDVQQLIFTVDHKGTDTKPFINVVVSGTIQNEPFGVANTYSPRFLQDPKAVPPTDSLAPTIEVTSPCDPDSTGECSPSYTTAASSVSLGGIAQDNIGVTEIRWRNDTTGSSGFATTFVGSTLVDWTTPAISLKPGVDNVLVMEARDADGNPGLDKLIAHSTATLDSPCLKCYSYTDCYNASSRVNLYWNQVDWATSYDVYQCSGSGCTPSFLTSDVTCYEDTTTTPPKGCRYSPDTMPLTEYSQYIVARSGGVSSLPSATYTVVSASDTCAVVSTSGSSGSGSGSSSGSSGSTGSADFSLSPSSGTITVKVSGGSTDPKSSTSKKIQVKPANGFDSTVKFSVSGGPSGMVPTFSPSSLTSGEYDSGTFFSVTVPNNTVEQGYSLTVNGSGGGKDRTMTITLDVKHGGTTEQ